MAQHWGNGFWNLLAFTMQMSLILVTGHAWHGRRQSIACSTAWPASRSPRPGHRAGDSGGAGRFLDQLGLRPGDRRRVRPRVGTPGARRRLPAAGGLGLLRLPDLARRLFRLDSAVAGQRRRRSGEDDRRRADRSHRCRPDAVRFLQPDHHRRAGGGPAAAELGHAAEDAESGRSGAAGRAPAERYPAKPPPSAWTTAAFSA